MLKPLLIGSQPTDPHYIRSYTIRVTRMCTTWKAHADLQLHRADTSFVDRLVGVTGDAVAISPNPVRFSGPPPCSCGSRRRSLYGHIGNPPSSQRPHNMEV